ncbi:hypothetical protein TNCV_133871 [Trichonephila clavipes]|nr:hypothetical protein TNCV_133871 [Trichonephila clavipes]
MQSKIMVPIIALFKNSVRQMDFRLKDFVMNSSFKITRSVTNSSHVASESEIYKHSTETEDVAAQLPLVNDRSTEVNDTPQNCQVIYSQFGLAIHQNDHQARRRFVEWAQNEIAVVPDFHKRILFSDEAHFWLNGYVNKQNCRI